MPAITVIVERLQLSENLIVGLGARHATIQLDNIAELAGEWAATRILHADEHALALAAFPGGDEVLDDLLGLADHLEVRVRVKMRAGGDVRPTDTYWLAVQVGETDQGDEIRLLVEHAADHYEIGPIEGRG